MFSNPITAVDFPLLHFIFIFIDRLFYQWFRVDNFPANFEGHHIHLRKVYLVSQEHMQIPPTNVARENSPKFNNADYCRAMHQCDFTSHVCHRFFILFSLN